MNWVDFVIIGIIAISVIVSFFRGFLREALSLLVWGLAIWLSIVYYADVEPLLPSGYGLPSTVRLVLAGILILLGVLIIGGIVTWIIGSIFDKTGMSGTDRVIGILFGALRGVVLVVIIVLLVSFLPFKDEPWWKESQVVPHFTEMAEWLRVRLPDEVPAYFERYLGSDPSSKPASVGEPASAPAVPTEEPGKSVPLELTPAPLSPPPVSVPAPVIPQGAPPASGS